MQGLRCNRANQIFMTILAVNLVPFLTAQETVDYKKVEIDEKQANAEFVGKGVKFVVDRWGDPDEIINPKFIAIRTDLGKPCAVFAYRKRYLLVLFESNGKVFEVDKDFAAMSDAKLDRERNKSSIAKQDVDEQSNQKIPEKSKNNEKLDDRSEKAILPAGSEKPKD